MRGLRGGLRGTLHGQTYDDLIAPTLKLSLTRKVQNRPDWPIDEQTLNLQPVAKLKASQVTLELLDGIPNQLALKR